MSLLGLFGCIREKDVHTASVDKARLEVQGFILSARSTGESAPAAVVLLRFDNSGATRAVVKAYRITWPGGQFEAEPRHLGIEARRHIERTARIDVRYGDIKALLAHVGEARIEILRLAHR